ncbi:MAG: sigma 54-interacting transcriptional regulator, partial [Bacteroidales bacterium]|nr:sigma 54-interacting transcriptional regulator [Bacteroidales bacterium]
KEINVDVRVIAASNKTLKNEIQKGNFREDLYHRLSVIIIRVPPLKERLDDIPVLVEHFINEFSSSMAKKPPEITDEAMQELQNLPWTGNIRELRNVIERLFILCDEQIRPEDVKKLSQPLE